MINKNEILAVVDEYDIPIGSGPRHEIHERGDWHRVSHIWVLNNQGQILCQQRSMQKDADPGKWQAFFGGHLTLNTGYLGGALLEINEELGLNLSAQDFVFVFRYKNIENKEFQGVFCVLWNGDVTNLQFEAEEVERISWIQIEELKKIFFDNNPEWSNAQYENAMFVFLENKEIPTNP